MSEALDCLCEEYRPDNDLVYLYSLIPVDTTNNT